MSHKERGAFYTPRRVAQFLVDWAVRSRDDLVFDPGVGRGIFLEEAFKRLVSLGAPPKRAIQQLYGIELDATSWKQTIQTLA